MLGYLKALFDWFAEIGGTWFGGIFDVLRRFKWFFVAILVALLSPIMWILQIAVDLTASIAASSQALEGFVMDLRIGEAGALWASIGAGAALMNCVVPIDVMLSLSGVLLSIWFVIFSVKLALWVYRHIPNIAGFGPGG